MSRGIGAVVAKSVMVREELEQIASGTGYLRPEDVLEKAKDEASPLHSFFTWDDGEAANMFRMAQARMLIRSIKIEIIRPAADQKTIRIESTREYVSPPSIRGEGSYVPVANAMVAEDLRKDLLDRAKRELIALKVKYSQLIELSKVFEAIDSI